MSQRSVALLRERRIVSDDAFVDLVVWRVPTAVRGSKHNLKYRLAFVGEGECVLRYDNQIGKGDHRHVGAVEHPYRFSTAAQLLADFWRDVERWRAE